MTYFPVRHNNGIIEIARRSQWRKARNKFHFDFEAHAQTERSRQTKKLKKWRKEIKTMHAISHTKQPENTQYFNVIDQNFERTILLFFFLLSFFVSFSWTAKQQITSQLATSNQRKSNGWKRIRSTMFPISFKLNNWNKNRRNNKQPNEMFEKRPTIPESMREVSSVEWGMSSCVIVCCWCCCCCFCCALIVICSSYHARSRTIQQQRHDDFHSDNNNN